MDAFIELLGTHGVLIVFAAVLTERLGPPIPAAAMLVVAGALGDRGQLSLPSVVLLSILASLLGDAVWMGAGRRFGYRVMRVLCRISVSPDSCVRQSEGLFTRWGGLSLVAAKFVPGVSVIAPPMAGALGMSWRRFLLWDSCGAALWTLLYVGLGVLFSSQIREVLAALADAGTKAAIGIALVVALVLAVRWLRRRAASDAAGIGRIGAEELFELLAAGPAPTLVDVRGPLARQASAPLAGALQVGLDGLAALADRLRDDDVVIYCSCPRDVSAIKGARMLRGLGIQRVRVLTGGHDAWLQILERRAPGGAILPRAVTTER